MINKNYVQNKLTKKFPEKWIENYNDLISDATLYSMVSQVAREENVRPKEWLRNNGFMFEQRYSSSIIDADCIRRIHLEFKLGQTALSRLLRDRVTKQWIDIILKNNLPTSSEDKWTGNEFDLIDREQIWQLIDQRKFNESNGEYESTLVNDRKGNFFLIIYNTDIDKYKVFFKNEIDEDLAESIEKERLHELSEDEIYLQQQCEIDYVMKKRCLSLENKHFSSIFFKASRLRSMDKKQFANFLGYDNAVSSKEKKDRDFIEFFENNIIESKVHISSSSSNQWIYNYASRAHMAISDFIAFFGYQHDERSFFSNRSKKYEIYKEELKSYVCGDDNKVYLPSASVLYQNLYRIATFEGILIDDIISSLGFERIDKTAYKENIKSSSFYVAIIDEMRRKILDEIKQNPACKKPSKTLSIVIRNRSQKLVKEIKEIYQYKCQLCSKEIFESPEIIMSDKSIYVEVHHIIPLSNETYDEELYLDNFENMVVVCPYHHKALHFHESGDYHKIEIVGDEMFLVNDTNNRFKIFTNYHIFASKCEPVYQ